MKSQMARKSYSHSCFTSRTCLLVLVLSSLAAVSSAAPLSLSPEAIGRLLLEWAIDGKFPEDTSPLTSALTMNSTRFHDLVCVLHNHYSRFKLALSLLPENDTRHSDISLITFMLKQATEMSCDDVKSSCTGCSALSCNIPTISSLCIREPSKREIFASLPTIILSSQLGENLPNLIQTWMRQNLSNKHLHNGVFDALASAVYSQGTIRCSIPQRCPRRARKIQCSY